jgi:hypothetical protein
MAVGCYYFRETVYFSRKNRQGQANFAESPSFPRQRRTTCNHFGMNGLRNLCRELTPSRYQPVLCSPAAIPLIVAPSA